jgi:hypothetical protein
VVCSGIFKVPFGPECLAAGQLRPSGAMTMKIVKNAFGIRTVKHMHNTEDARVKVSAVTQLKDKKKGESGKAKVAQAAKAIKRIPYYVWLWDKSVDAWGWVCENAETIFGMIP